MHPWYLLRLVRLSLTTLGSTVRGFFVRNTRTFLKEGGDTTFVGTIFFIGLFIAFGISQHYIGEFFGGTDDEKSNAAFAFWISIGVVSFLSYKACGIRELMPKKVRLLFDALHQITRYVEYFETKQGSKYISMCGVPESIERKLYTDLPRYLERLKYVSVEEIILTEMATHEYANRILIERVEAVLKELEIQLEEQVKLPFYARQSSK